MSPTIPPVLVLSLLLVPPLPVAEAGELMDLFALIRGTLKYWRRIYQMYEDEVVLGYCWAEYFLHPEDDTKNNPAPSSPVPASPSNVAPVEDYDSGPVVSQNMYNGVLWNDWAAWMDRNRVNRRGKRSCETANVTTKLVSGIFEKNSEVYLKTDSGRNLVSYINVPENERRGLTGFMSNNKGRYDSRRSFEWLKFMRRVLEIFREYVGVHLRIGNNNDLNYMKLPKNKQGNLIGSLEDGESYCSTKRSDGVLKKEIVEILGKNSSVKMAVTSNSKAGKANLDAKNDDPVAYRSFPRNLQENRPSHRSRRSSEISNSTNGNVEEISKISANGSVRRSTTSDVHFKADKIKFESSELSSSFKSKKSYPRKDRTKDTFLEDIQKISSVSTGRHSEPSNFMNLNAPGVSNKISKRISAKSNKQRLSSKNSIHDARAKVGKLKDPSNQQGIPLHLDFESMNSHRREDLWFPAVNQTRRSPFPILSSSSTEQRANQQTRLYLKNSGKMAGINEEFKGTQAEGDLRGKSKNLQVGTRRKFLYPKTNRFASATPSRLKHPERPGSRSFPVTEIASLNWRLKDIGRSEEREGNGEPSDSLRRGKFSPSNLEFQEAEQRPGSFRGNYRRNLRRKRDANDRIRSRPNRPLSKTGRASSYNPTESLDEIPRFSSKYTEPGIESRSISSRNDDETFKRSVERLLATKTVGTGKIPIYYLKHHRNALPTNQKSTLETSSVVLEGFQTVSSHLIDIDPQTFHASTNRLQLKNPSENENRKRGNKRGEGNGSKQLPTANDNRYRRNEHAFPVEKLSVAEQTGKKSTARHPVGRPSLLPVSYPRFMGDYGSSTGGTARNSSRSSWTGDQGRRSSRAKVEARGLGRAHGTLFYLRQAFMGFLRTLGFFVNVGRQLVDYVDSNSALACTKDYFVGKVVQWIDS